MRVASSALSADQQALVARNLGLVGLHLRNRVPTPRQPMRQREYEDLFQEGCLALIRAAIGRFGEIASEPSPAHSALELAIWSDRQKIQPDARVKYRALVGKYL